MKVLRIIGLAILSSFVFGFAMQMSIPTFTVYLSQLNVPLEFIGGISLGLALSALIFRPIAAHMIHKFGATLTSLGGALISIISFLGYALFPQIIPVIFLRVLQGISVGIFTTAVPTLIAQVTPKDQLIKVMGYSSLSGAAAAAFGPFLGLYLIAGGAFNSLFMVGLLLNGVALMFMLPLFKVNPQEDNLDEKPQGSSNIFKSEALFPSIVIGVMMFVQSGIMAFISLHGKVMGLDNIGFYFIFNFVGLIFSRLTTTWLTQKLSLKLIILIHGLILASSMYALSVSSTLTAWAIIAVTLGYAFNVLFVILNTMALKNISHTLKGKANALFFGAIDMGFFMGGLIWGILAKASSIAFVYQIGSGLLLLLTFSVMFFIQQRKIKF